MNARNLGDGGNSCVLHGGLALAEATCGDSFLVRLTTIVTMLVMLAVLLLAACGIWGWIRSGDRLRTGSHAAVARSMATRRRGLWRRGGHAVAVLSVTRRPRAHLAPGHASAGPSATLRQRR